VRGVALILLLAVLMPSSAEAAFEPIGLSVDGGEETWHAEPSFAVRWSNPPGVAAVHYRLLDPGTEAVLAEARIGWAATAIQHLAVPPAPGAYTAAVWLEDALGVEGAPAVATLRFDDEAPQPVAPVAPSGWLGRADFPLTLRIGHPDQPLPLSGIRGYAISIDQDPGGTPCAEPPMCDTGETDLQGGTDVDALEVAGLPEGVSYAHAVAVSGSGVRSSLVGTAELRVDETDPVTQLSGAPEGWSRRPVTLVATATDAGAGMTAPARGPVPFTAIRVDGGAPTAASGGSVSATVIESGAHSVAFYARDAAGNADDGGLVNGLRNRAPRTALVRIDREPPALAFAGAQDPAEPERIDATVADSLSGVDPATARIAVRPAGSGTPYEPLPTRLAGSGLSAHWSSEAYPPGDYEFRATVADEAGNPASTTTRANGAPMRLSNPIKVLTRLDVTLARKVKTAGCRQRAVFGGRLTAGRRTPVAGATVDLVERFAAGSARRERVSTIRTGVDGGFDLRLSPGPSRRVIARARSTATLQGTHSSHASLPVPACVSLHVSAPVARVGGRPIVFGGRVQHEGAELPAEGAPVQLQFRLPGLPWSEFRTVHTDRRGAFRFPYRFADDDSRGVRFRFRAFVAARAGWPFAPAGSPPVEVLGR